MDYTTPDADWEDLGSHGGLNVRGLYRGREEPETVTDDPPRFSCYVIRAYDTDTVKLHAQTYCFERNAINWPLADNSRRGVIKQRLQKEADRFIKELIDAGHKQEGPLEREVT
jgi:hypothetical protein